MASFHKRRYEDLLSETNGHCFYCGIDLTNVKKEIDHILPKSHGGNGSRENCAISCIRCNRLKWDFSIEEFRIRLERKLKRPVLFFFEYYGIEKVAHHIRYRNTLNKRMF